MRKLTFVQIDKNNEKQYQDLLSMWIPYIREIDSHKEAVKHKSDTEIAEGARLRVGVQGSREDMHFELCYDGNELIGFGFYAVDIGGIKGLIDAGYGYIMEFYIVPEKRRKGYGRLMFEHIEAVFKGHQAPFIYLTPDSINGIPFWRALNFTDSGKLDPDNKQPIYIK